MAVPRLQYIVQFNNQRLEDKQRQLPRKKKKGKYEFFAKCVSSMTVANIRHPCVRQLLAISFPRDQLQSFHVIAVPRVWPYGHTPKEPINFASVRGL